MLLMMAAEDRDTANAQPDQNAESLNLEADDPRKLTFDQWEAIAEGTGILRGWVVLQGSDEEGCDVKVAPSSVFKLTQGKKTSFICNLKSKTERSECKTHLEEKLLEASFTKKAVKLALSGGTTGFMLGLSGEGSWLKELNSSSSTTDDVTWIHSSRTFPQAILYLSDDQVEPSDKCIEFLNETLADPGEDRIGTAVKSFEKTFGVFFAKEVTLGARRYEIHKVQGRNQSKSDEQNAENKINAGAEVSSMNFGGKMSGGLERGKNATREYGSSGEKSRTGLQVIGGSTGANTEEEWVNSIGPYLNWKAIKHEELERLLVHLKWVIARDSKLTKFSKLVNEMLMYSNWLDAKGRESLRFPMEFTLENIVVQNTTTTTTTTTTKRIIRFLSRKPSPPPKPTKSRILKIDGLHPAIIDWIVVTIPEAGIKNKVYEPQFEKQSDWAMTAGEKVPKPIEIKVEGPDILLQVTLVLQLKGYRWLSRQPPDVDPMPDIRRYRMNWTLADKDEKVSRFLEYGHVPASEAPRRVS